GKRVMSFNRREVHDRHCRYGAGKLSCAHPNGRSAPTAFRSGTNPAGGCADWSDPATPEPVRAWIANAPAWLQVRALRSQPDPRLYYLDEGEREAIALAEGVNPYQPLVDETSARKEAARRKLHFIGTPSVHRTAIIRT